MPAIGRALLGQGPVPSRAELGDSPNSSPKVASEMDTRIFHGVIMGGGEGRDTSIPENSVHGLDNDVLPAAFSKPPETTYGSGEMSCNLSGRLQGPFPGHGRYFCLGAEIFSFEIIKQHAHLLGNFARLVI